MIIVLMLAALIFLGLNAFYWVLYKFLSWRTSFIQPVAVRVRFWVYLLIPLCTLNWIGMRLAHDALASTSFQPWITWLPRYSITIVLLIIVVETVLVLVFESLYTQRRGITVPGIVQSFVRGLVYVGALLLVLFNFFDVKVIAGVLIGAAVLLVGIALLMQDALNNLFAGISLQITRLYATGDWLRVDGKVGQVEATDWRALTLRTASGEQIILPLSMLAKMEVVNLSAGHTPHADDIEVVVEYAYSPDRVETALRAALTDIEGISTQLASETRLLGYTEAGIRYALRCWITDFTRREAVITAVYRAVWYHFRRAGIRFAYPSTQVYLQECAQEANLPERIRLLREIAFLRILTAEQVQQLAACLHLQLFAGGESICHQGEAGETFYVIARGSVRVSVRDDAEHEIFAQTLQAGNFFGEFSLLTGAPRTATVTAVDEAELLVMDKAAMRQALEANPLLADHISGILAQRQHELQESRERVAVTTAGQEVEPLTVETLKGEILTNILRFFSY